MEGLNKMYIHVYIDEPVLQKEYNQKETDTRKILEMQNR